MWEEFHEDKNEYDEGGLNFNGSHAFQFQYSIDNIVNVGFFLYWYSSVPWRGFPMLSLSRDILLSYLWGSSVLLNHNSDPCVVSLVKT